jgi:class 3 adenylate cyclase/tetratricopeptide (TPR) repeat protein
MSLQVASDHLARAADERRVVTVLFADLSGSTALAERLDAEDMRTVLADVFDVLAREVLKLEGTVDKYIGDEIMAVFGAPVAHENDAARAVEAAMAMQQAMATLNTSLDRQYGARLELRVGINTGEVVSGVLGGQLQASYTVVGDTVNTAKRVQSAARPGEIIVGERTRQATARSFEFAPAGAIAAKGKAAPVPAFRFLRALAEQPRMPGPSSRTFVGRATERATLLAAIERARNGRGGVVAIRGEPGMGKSRLLTEGRSAARASGVTWLQGQTSSYGQTMSYLPFREMLRSFAGIETGDSDESKWTKLSERVHESQPAHAEEILPYIGSVLALRLTEKTSGLIRDLDSEAMRRQVLRAMYLLFDGLAQSAHAVVAFEDWHWADRSSEQLLTHLLPLSDRVLFIWTGRNDPGTAAERAARTSRESAVGHYDEITLAPLSPEESTALVGAALDTQAVPASLQAAVVRRSEGNPFFVEEILRALRDIGVLTRDDTRGEWVLGDDQDPATLPTTVQGVIAARLDRLSDDAREVAGVAAVIGRTFSYRLLVAVGSGLRNVENGLDELARQSLIRERHVGEREYAFTHALIQETVYAGLLVRTRRELHGRVAAAIELIQGGDYREERYGVLAYHYAQAENWPKAQDYLFKVGDQSLRIAADTEAVGHYERALDAYARAFGDRWDPFARATIERKIGEARYRLGEFDRATRHLDRALDLLRAGRPRTLTGVRLAIAAELVRQVGHRIAPWVRLHRTLRPEVSAEVLQTLWFHQFIDYSSDLERLLYDILRTLNIAERSAPSHRTLRAYFGMTLMCHNVGLQGMGSRYASMAQSMARQIGGPLATALADASIGLDDYAMGRWAAAAERLSAAASGYFAAGELEPWAGISGYLNLVLVGQGRLGEALPIADDLERTGKIARDQRIEGLGPHDRAYLLGWAGRQREARAAYDRAIANYRAIPDYHLLAFAVGDCARMLVRSDDLDAGRALIEEGDRVAKEHHLAGWVLTHLIAARADLLLRTAERDPGQRAPLLREADRVIRKLRSQGRLHAEAVPVALRLRGSLEWLRGRADRARVAWRDSLVAADRMGSVTEALETHGAIARYTLSVEDEQSAGTIAARLHAQARVAETA